MTLWPILAVMTAVVLALVLLPLLRRAPAVAARRDHDLSVYRAQLAELARDEQNGLLGAEEARAARLEIERRMLAADAERAPAPAAATRRPWLLGATLALALPALTLLLYARLGRPDLPEMPFAAHTDQPTATAAEAGSSLPSVEAMIARLEEQVATAPDDLTGWLRLGRAYSLSGLPAKAVGAYEKAAALEDGNAEIHSALGEARIEAAGNVVTETAAADLERALELDPGNARARFYQALAHLQRGERREALAAWSALAADTPADAPYLPVLRERITALAGDLGVDLAEALPEPQPPAQPPEEPAQSAPRGLDSAQMQAMQGRPPAEQAEMIRGMVKGLAARLEAEPDDVEGWRMLARSYGVLGESAKAAEAAQQVARLLPEDPAAQSAYGEALLALQADDQPLAPAAVEQWQKVAALDADNPQALFLLGRAAAERGDLAAARDLWQRVLAAIPPDAPQRAQLQAMIDQLDAAD